MTWSNVRLGLERKAGTRALMLTPEGERGASRMIITTGWVDNKGGKRQPLPCLRPMNRHQWKL